MTIFWIVLGVVIVLIFLFLGGSKYEKTSNEISSIENIGMYNMELYQKHKKLFEDYDRYASIYNKLIGLACQGRIEEIKEIFTEELIEDEFESEFIQLMKDNKKKLLSMGKMALKVEDNLEGMKTGESIGEYTDRKLLKKKAFMTHYDFFNSFDLKAFYNTIF